MKNKLSSIVLVSSISMIIVAPYTLADTSDSRLHEIEHLFESANVLSGPTIVDCKLSGGTDTKCFSITVKAEPKSYTPGPWCPQNLTDGAEKSGIWFVDGEAVDADGEFMSKLASTYDDKKWQMVDPQTGKINVTNTKEQCAAAARPDVGVEYENFCVQCLPEYMDDDASVTYTIALEPQDVLIGKAINRTGAGVALNGIRLDGPAPVDAILGAYTVAPFDDCGGHVNLNVGYHYHAATNCIEGKSIDGDHASTIGIAMDGYKILSHKNLDGSDPKDLDRCYGHKTDDIGYHYHAGKAGTNANLGCLAAEAGCVSGDPDAICDATARRRH